jgi:hypothetical protein
VNAVMELRVARKSGRVSNGYKTGGLSSSGQLRRDSCVCVCVHIENTC